MLLRRGFPTPQVTMRCNSELGIMRLAPMVTVAISPARMWRRSV
jgi:hypothetical protein